MRHVVLTPIEDGYWMAEVPSLPGCHTQGESKEEALEMIKEAIEIHSLTLQDMGKPIPEDTIEFATV